MKQHISTKGLLKGVIVIVLAALALSFLALSGSGVVKAQPRMAPVPASWEYQLDSVDTTAASAQQLNIDGVAAKVQSLGNSKYRLVMSGSQGTEQIRQALYSPRVAGFIDGTADIEINMPVSNLNKITVDVESNLSTGYHWTVVAGTGFTQVGESAFTQSAGAGAPCVQTLVLQPKAVGNGSIKLAYRRSFGPAETATRLLHITLAAQAAGIDLSDPAPKVIDEHAAVTGSAVDTQDPASELPSNPSLPASLDWRTSGIVPAIRDQGQYGSCWAFGTVGAMESAIKKAGGPMTDLSEQFLVSCNKDGWGDGGMTAHKYHYNTLGLNQTAIGAVLESAKPYTASKGTCSVAYSHPYKLSGWGFVTGEFSVPTVTQIKNAIYTYGPVTIAMCAGPAFQAYSGGIFSTNETSYCSGGTDHIVILVGWNDATQSWILRNSWGTSWGENGYMRIAYGTSNVGYGTSWVKYISGPPSPIPTPQLPTGTITTTLPTYQWTKVTGATQYRYQLYKGAALVYTKTVTSSVCGASVCTNKPATALTYAAYKWRVQALVGGVWKTYSAFMAFTVAKASNKPKAGYWLGSYNYFYVAATQTSVNKFTVGISVPACGISGTITEGGSQAIVSNKFSFTGTFYASGTFTTTLAANGTDGLNDFYIAGCGYVSGGPWSWTTAWHSASMPADVVAPDAQPATFHPGQVLTDGLTTLTITDVNP